MTYTCPRGHTGRFVQIKPVYRYELVAFLFWSWLVRRWDGDLVRCVHHGCGRAWVVARDGVREPAALAPQPPEPSPNGHEAEDDGDPRPPVPVLAGAVRRGRL